MTSGNMEDPNAGNRSEEPNVKTQIQMATALDWARKQMAADGGTRPRRDIFAEMREILSQRNQPRETLEAELAAYLTDLLADPTFAPIVNRVRAAQTLESVTQRADVVVALTGVQAKGEVGTVSPQSSAASKSLAMHLLTWAPMIALILQFLQGTAYWDQIFKGQTPGAQAADRALLAEAIAAALVRELQSTAPSPLRPMRKQVEGTVPVRESPRFSSRVIGQAKRGIVVDVLAVDGPASRIRWTDPNGKVTEAWIFSRYLAP